MVSTFGFVACHSGPPHGRGGEHREAVHVPRMEAAGTFFDGQVVADIRFGRATFPGRPGDPADSEGGPRRGGGGHGPRGGGNSGGDVSLYPGMGANSMALGKNVGFGGGGGPREESGVRSPVGARARSEHNPAVQLHLTLTNRSPQPLEIEVLAFDSLLGNFVVTPEKLPLAPDQTASFDPMTSRLGIPQGDLPLKVRLRSGEKSEEQTLTLKIVSSDGS